MLDKGMSEDLANGKFGNHITLTYIVLNGEHCFLTSRRPVWNGYDANPVPDNPGQLAGLQPAVTWKEPVCDNYDDWSWGCGQWLQNNPRRKQALDWLSQKYAILQYDKWQLIAHHYMRQRVYHFQQMGDAKVTSGVNTCRLFQMGRSTWERFVNFKHSFYAANVNPSMTYQQAVSWANQRFIGLSVFLPGQEDYHDQGWMLRRPEVLKVMGLVP